MRKVPARKSVMINSRRPFSGSARVSQPGSARVSQPQGSARVSRPRRKVRPKVSPFAQETFGRRRGSVRDRPQQRKNMGARFGRGSPDPALRFGAGLPTPRFGAGLPTPPKGPTEGLPIRSGDLRSAAWLGQRPATTAQIWVQGSARVSRPRLKVRAGIPTRFGAGLPTPPKGPTEGLPIRLGDLRSATWLGQRPATTRPATTRPATTRPEIISSQRRIKDVCGMCSRAGQAGTS